MSDFVQRIYDFNKDNGLLEKGYSDYLESSYQIEEALEPFQVTYLADLLVCEPTHKQVSRAIVECTKFGDHPTTDVDRLDKACDAIVFAVGSMAKLGLIPSQIHAALNIVMDANLAKSGCPKDAEGKLLKGSSFEGPEPRLQMLLELR